MILKALFNNVSTFKNKSEQHGPIHAISVSLIRCVKKNIKKKPEKNERKQKSTLILAHFDLFLLF